MKCSCDIDIGISDYDNPVLYNKQDVSAIIYHKCDECNYIIQPGEPYELVYGKWGDFTETYHTCLGCLNLRNIFFPYGFIFSDLWEIFDNELNTWEYQVPEDCMVKLSKRNLNRVCELIEKGWKHLEEMEGDNGAL